METSNSISIIIPVYNSGQYLNRCLDSVLSQTYTSLEVICIDDGSIDDSLSILDNYKKSDTRIKVYRNPSNMGVSYTRNRGIDLATGNWIAFVDSDDWIELGMYQKMIQKANEHGVDVVMSDLVIAEGNLRKDYSLTSLKQTYFTKKEILQDLLPRFSWPGYSNLGLFSFTTKIFYTSLIKENRIYFDTKTSYEEDKIFIINVFLHSAGICYIPENFYKYEVHSTGLYSNFNIKAWQWYVYNYQKKQNLIIENNIRNINQQALKEEFIYNISWFLYRSSSRKDIKNPRRLRYQVLKDANVISICRECLPMLTSLDRLIAKAICTQQCRFANWLIRFSFSPHKDKLLNLLKKFR